MLDDVGPDVIVSLPREYDKSRHKWQQSESVFARLVDRFTRPGDLVVDPFAGSGTTGRAATSQQRRFWGCDADEACAHHNAGPDNAAPATPFRSV